VKIEELAAKYAYSILGYDLVYFSEVAFPVWRVNLSLLMLQEVPLNVVDEFILKLVEIKIDRIEAISNILGIDDAIISDATANLMRSDNLRFENSTKTFMLTDKGKETLENIKILVPEERYFSFYIDAITGIYSPVEGYNFNTPQSIKQQAIHSIHPSKNVPRPVEESISFSKLESLLRDMQRKGQGAVPKGDILEINSIEKVFMMYKKLRVLVFYDFQTKKYQYMVFDRDHRASEFDGVLLTADIEEQLGVLPVEKIELRQNKILSQELTTVLFNEASVNSEELVKIEKKLLQLTQDKSNIKYFKTDEVEILKSDIEGLKKTTRLLRRFEFRMIMEKSLEESRKWVIILVPFLLSDTFDDDLLARIDKTLQQSTKVYLIYGTNTETKNSWRLKEEKNILNKLRAIKEKKHGKYLKIKQIVDTEEKVLISDTNFMTIGNYSWLEMNGNSGTGLRLEKNIYTENRQQILQTIEEIEGIADLTKGDIKLNNDRQVNGEIAQAKVFFSYSHKDEGMRDELEKHLIMLKRKKIISTWHDRKIDAGGVLDKEIDENLKHADIILLLVSVDFLASNYCYEIEMEEALRKHSNEEAVVIPIILRSCDWQSAPFSGLLALPLDGKHVSSWEDKDDAFLNIAKSIENVAIKINKKKSRNSF
jgi:hypothetical protein